MKNTEKFSRSFASIAVFMLLLSAAQIDAAESPRRILSLAPASTEILFDLGLGDRVVAVTKYCKWPPETSEKQNIGDMMNVNMEVVMGLAPDLVAISNMNEHIRAPLEALGYKTVTVGQDDFAEICESMLKVGEACGIPERAEQRVEELKASVREISEAAARGSSSPRVLIVVGRDISDSSLKSLYVAGKMSFYNDLLTEANARNAFDSDVRYAQLSREGLLRLDPDIVIELIGEHGTVDAETPFILGQWRAFDDLRASAENVAVMRGDFALRAGPRYPLLLKAFIDAIHNGERDIDEVDYLYKQ